MPTKKYRPYTPSRRFMTTSDFAEVTKDTPEKSLTGPIKKTGGMSSSCRVQTWSFMMPSSPLPKTRHTSAGGIARPSR